jgi:hypothetical protein
MVERVRNEKKEGIGDGGNADYGGKLTLFCSRDARPAVRSGTRAIPDIDRLHVVAAVSQGERRGSHRLADCLTYLGRRRTIRSLSLSMVGRVVNA